MTQARIEGLNRSTAGMIHERLTPMLQDDRAAGRRSEFVLFTNNGSYGVRGFDGVDGTKSIVEVPAHDGVPARRGLSYGVAVTEGPLKVSVTYAVMDDNGEIIPGRVAVWGIDSSDMEKVAETANRIVGRATESLRVRRGLSS